MYDLHNYVAGCVVKVLYSCTILRAILGCNHCSLDSVGKEPELKPESKAADNQAMVAGVSVSSVLLLFAVVIIVILVAVIAVIKYRLPSRGRTSGNKQLVVSHEEVDQSPTHRTHITGYSHIESTSSTPVKSKKKPFVKSRKAKKVYSKDDFEDSTC